MAIVRYTFTGRLELTGALHIGSGGGGRVGTSDAPTDATVIRDSRGRPYIPGSSLRGVLRSAILQLAPVLLANNATFELRDEECRFAQLKREVEQAVNQARNRLADTPELFDAEAIRQEQLIPRLSAVERLFGTVLWSSPLHIPDMHLLDRDTLDGEIRHGVGIDRDTGAAREAIKYDFEVLPAGAAFTFWMRCDIPEQPEEYHTLWPRLLAIGLRLLEQGDLTLGGRAARGVGQVRLNNLQVYRLDMADRSALLDSLLAEQATLRYGVALPGGWTRVVLQELR